MNGLNDQMLTTLMPRVPKPMMVNGWKKDA
jgi:hypothetical protein